MPDYSLMQHQTEGVKFLHDMDGVAALLWEPGVGKTGTTLTWIDQMASRKGEFRVLVVAPKTAVDTWVLQAPPFMDSVVKARMLEPPVRGILTKIANANTWTKVPRTKVMADHKGSVSGNRQGKVTILGLGAGAISSWCQTRVRTVQMLKAVRNYQPHLIVVDESQIIKAHNSNISKALYQMGQMAPHRIILTGTVNPHSPLDCYGQWRFLAPWTFSDSYGEDFTQAPHTMTKTQTASIKVWPWGRFRDRYGVMGGYEGKNVVEMNEFTVPELHDRVAERSMVVLKADALDLPPVTDITVPVHLTPAEQRVYDEMRRDLQAQLDSGELVESPNALAKYMKLRQITAGFLRDTENDVTHRVGDSKIKATADLINTTLAGEDRVVVFAYFRSECAAIAEELEAEGRTVELITGATHARDRLAIRQRFGDVSGNPEPIVLVAQARTMSLSVNELVTAQHAVFTSLSERRDDWVQARGRLDRNGQTLPVTFWNMLCPGLVDEVMIDTHHNRGDMEAALISHIKSTPR